MVVQLRNRLHRRLRPQRYAGLQELLQNQQLSRADLQRTQQQMLARILDFARRRTDFYAAYHGYLPGNAALQDYPVLRKDQVRQNAQSMIDRALDKRLLRQAHTGGSTGQPLAYFYTGEKTELMRAGMMRSYMWSGWRPGERIVNFWGAPQDLKQVPGLMARLRHWAAAELTIPAYNFAEQDMADWLHTIRRYRPVLLQGYASVLARFAGFLLDQGQHLPPLKGVYSTAEVLHDHQRRIMEQAFGCKVFNQYGSREIPNMAMECRQGNMHVLSDRVVMESVEEKGVNKLLVTSLTDFTMPFIRYEIGDTGRLLDDACSCGLPFPLMRMDLCRSNDLITTPSGKTVYPAYFIHLLDEIHGVQQFQFVQERSDRVMLNIQASRPLPDSSKSALQKRVAEDLGLHLHISRVKNIAKTPSGKHRFVVNRQDDGSRWPR